MFGLFFDSGIFPGGSWDYMREVRKPVGGNLMDFGFYSLDWDCSRET